ncbi:MAG: hypothetical protein HY660_14280 [Armatimonadetes bacterium]|nr:hypothetical protein [Armatimonadota bacterium]
MPIYEYRCTKCGHQFEVYQQVSDAPVSTCEQCGGSVRRVFSPVGIIFKGSGFHATDYRKNSAPSDGGGAKPTASDSKSGDGKAKAGESASKSS